MNKKRKRNTLVHVEDAHKRQQLAVDRERAGRDVELGERRQRERLEQPVPDQVQRVGPGHAQPYLDRVVLVVRVHEPVVHQEVRVGAHPVEYVHLIVGRVVAVRVAHAHVVRLLEVGGQLQDGRRRGRERRQRRTHNKTISVLYVNISLYL